MKLFRGNKTVRLTKALNRNIMVFQRIIDRIKMLNSRLDMAIEEQETIIREANEEINELSQIKQQNSKMLKNFENLIN